MRLMRRYRLRSGIAASVKVAGAAPKTASATVASNRFGEGSRALPVGQDRRRLTA